MADKIVNQLPVVLQTKAIKNFFEATVEQLYSEANITPVNGFIGKKTGEDAGVSGAFIEESTADRRQYNLVPAINNLNPLTGDSENLMFYDEFIDTLNVYGVSTTNHNRIFGSRYRVFMPPIDIDKFVNFQEYYWSPTGPSSILIEATLDKPLNLDVDIIGKKTFTYGSTTLRNGMIVNFADNDNTIPTNSSTTGVHKAGVDYIVGGVGESIYFVEKELSDATLYGGSNVDKKDYIVIERGAENATAWSRVNHWHHRNNFLDAGDQLPDREYRGKRPIIEFNKDLEMYNHGTSNYGVAHVAVTSLSKVDVTGQTGITIDTRSVQDGDILFFPNESETNRTFLYTVSGVGASILLTPTSSTPIAKGQTVVIAKGNVFEGADYLYNGIKFAQAQKKIQINQTPLFVLYDDAGNRLDDAGLYTNSTFEGSKIFGYKVGTGTPDAELGFPLTYTPYKAVSEITFENFIQTDDVEYRSFGATSNKSVLGSYYYKLLKDTPEYHSYWKLSGDKNEQKIITTHYIGRDELDDETLIYNIGAVPNASTITSSGYDILVKVNGAIVTDYVYEAPSSIKFNSFTFDKADVIDIEVTSDTGITKISDSRYEIPLSWRTNPFNEEIELVAEPQYLSHFKRYIERQEGFLGDPLASNNFSSTSKDLKHAKDIIQTDQDIILAAYLLDDQPHNFIESIRFSAREYEKYRARLINEITKYVNTFPTDNLTNEHILERVLRNLISFSVGKEVFGTTYVLPFGDNYKEEKFDVGDLTINTYTMTNYADLETIENSLLVYWQDAITGAYELLTIGKDYNLSSTNPITIEVTKTVGLGDTITAKLYDIDRDSAECPATPSTMGMYPLFTPCIETDSSFQTPQQLLVGHDGSKTALTGSVIDDVLLEFEKRLFNTSMQSFRDRNSLPRLNVGDVRSGYFRTNNFSSGEYHDLLRNSFTNWIGANKVDHVTNEFYDATNTWTWNYRGRKDLPGHWRGWYEYYYDTVRPHTHPWEMLGFTEEPTWWDSQYGTSYGWKNFDMWGDLEKGIIRQGPRENYITGEYLSDNIWARPGLSELVPVDENANLLPPGKITNTGSTTNVEQYSNRRLANQDVTDKFTDVAGNNNLPNGITLTYGSSDATRVLFDANAAPQAGTFWDYDGLITVNVNGSGFAEGFDGFTTPFVYVEDSITNKSYQLYNYKFTNLTQEASVIIENVEPIVLPDTTIGLTVTGTPILNPANVSSWNNEGQYYDSNTFRNNVPVHGTYFIEPKHAGLTEWSTTEHSPVVGWSFDGLPIYGPYGYSEYDNAGQVVDSSIRKIKSAFKLREGIRPDGPGGRFTGEFVQDYTLNPTNAATFAGETGSPALPKAAEYNMRFGVTPDSPTSPIYFYVATVDDNGDPMFPYCIGGTEQNTNTYKGQYFTVPVEPVKNNTGSVNDSGPLVAVSSSVLVTASTDDTVDNVWRFGDGAPVENAWKYSCGYPFAVVEALFLSKPGKFVTSFSDPTRITAPVLDKFKIINSASKTPFSFTDPDHFCIHGSVDSNGNTVRNVGYTQFIHSWLKHQDLNTTTDFADKLRKLNIKLAHRMAGFTDKDTLSVRADQTSVTTTSQSLVIPNENLEVVVHSSPYKTRNYYTGLSIQKTASGYKVKGFDKNTGYFNVLRRNLVGNTTLVEVGGEASDYVVWQPLTSYPKETIVSYNNSFYRAPTLVPSSDSFIASLWTRLPSLPQKDGIRATLFLDDLPYVDRVDYQTEFTSYQEVVNLIVGIGAYQESIGFDFGDYDNSINDVRNWNYVVRQFLFWVAGGWETNNTLDLSPLANKVTFNSTTGMVAGINRTDKNQFTLLDQDGVAINPKECEIVREGNRIEITPPSGSQIYGTLLFTKEIEHALVFDNVTDFNDVLFDTVHNHAQTRLKIKGKKTANWSGLFSTEGFIIQEDELRPNLDNMAQSLGRYHELGFVPVEKQIYEQARGLFGYQEREYLNNLEIEDDDQFEFYKGMLQSKGTASSLGKISKSSNIVQGEMKVYDEWALKVGDFGDLENDQTIELKLEKSDVRNDPQMITLVFPEDTTGVIDAVKLIQPKHKYHAAPVVEIAPPSGTPAVQATAVAELEANGVLKAINITNAGSGYEQPVRLTVIAGNTSISNVNTVFNTPIATSTLAIPSANINSLGSITIDGVAVPLNTAGLYTMANVVSAINTNASVNSIVTASFITNPDSSTVLTITGADFTLGGSALANLNLASGNYQPRQRFNIASVDNHPDTNTGATTINDIAVTVDNSVVPSSFWDYDPGSRQAIPFNVGTSQNPDTSDDDQFVNSGDVVVPLTVSLDPKNIVKENNLTYSHANVFVNGTELINIVGDQKYTLTTAQLTIHNVETLPGSRLQSGANIYVIENSTVEFKSNYTGDLPGADLNIKVSTNDDIAITTKSKRLFDITPDVKEDDTILIDIDDSTRFLKKPIGVREQNLWPTTSNVSYTGMTSERFTSIPNAGYVNSSNVDFSAFDVPSIADMFRDDFLIQPDANSTVHVAVSDNKEWNVYKFKEADTDISFVEMEGDDATAYLYANVSLFNYTDSNQIGNTDLGRFLDYHIAVKDAVVSDKFVLWVNEEVVNNKQVRLSNITPVAMTEEFISSIGPRTLKTITNIEPGVSRLASALLEPIGNDTVKVYADASLLNDDVNPLVRFNTSNITVDEQLIFGQTYSVSNINVTESTFTFTQAGLSGNISPPNVSVEYFGRTQITSADHGYSSGDQVRIVAGNYSGVYQVEMASANTFCIDTPFIQSGVTSGNILTSEIKIVTQRDHGIAFDYKGKKIAMHQTGFEYYNQVYTVSRPPRGNEIIVTGIPYDDQTKTLTANTAVVTTLDHDVISLNNSNLKIDNITSLEGMIESLNRGFDLRRGWVTHRGSFQMRIPMLNKPYNKKTGTTPLQTKGTTPYVTNFNGVNTKNVTPTGALSVSQSVNAKKGFNKLTNGAPSVKKVNANRGQLGPGVVAGRVTTTQNVSAFNPQPAVPTAAATAAVSSSGTGTGVQNYTPTFPNGQINTTTSGTNTLFTNLLNTLTTFTTGGTVKPAVTGGPNPHVTIPTVSSGGGAGMTNNLGAPVLNGAALASAAPANCGELIVAPPPIPPNRPPEALDQHFTTPYETPISGNMLTGFPVPVYDPDGHPIELATTGGDINTAIILQPSHGTLSNLQADGSFTYTPDAGFEDDEDFFRFKIRDIPPVTTPPTPVLEDVGDVFINVGQKPVIPPAPTVFEKCELVTQSTRSSGVDDQWYYRIEPAGRVKMIIDMDAAHDALTVFQGTARVPSGGTRRVATGDANLRKATAAEKQMLMDQRALAGHNTHGGSVQDFSRANGFPNSITFCGVLEFDFDPANGEYLRVDVEKRSSVYRYVICYPTYTDPGTLTTPPGGGAVAGGNTGGGTGNSHTRNSGRGGRRGNPKSTPIYNPTGNPTTKNKVNTTVNPAAVGGGGRSWHKYGGPGPTFSHNFGGFSLAPMAGYTHMPSIFKKTVKTVNPQNVGRLQPLEDGRYVNVTQQRVTGGRVIPLAAPMPAPIPFVQRAIRGVDIALVPGNETFGNSKYWGNDLVDNQILKIASDGYSYHSISVPGVDNFDGFNTAGSEYNQAGADGTRSITTLAGAGPNVIPGNPVVDGTIQSLSNQALAGSIFTDTLTPGETVPSEDAPLDPDVAYTNRPIITVQPKRKVNDRYVPAGPKAVIPLVRPGPQFVLSEADVTGATPGDQVIINNQTITIQGSPAATLKEFECSGGFGYTATAGQSTDGATVTVSACGGVPLTVRDGCRGGTYKEVLDFHVVKNFSLVDVTIPSILTPGNSTVISEQAPVSSHTTGTHVAGTTSVTVNTNTTGNANTITRSTGLTNTLSPPYVQESKHTGGKGYQVGDRLRVVGGTPVASPFGPIDELCVEIPGMFYSTGADAENIHVFIGDGTTPGAGAEAGQPVMNDRGQIERIPIINGGFGYDPANPPKIRIVDGGAGMPEFGQKIPAKIRPIIKTRALGNDGKFHPTSGMPERPAKFQVTAVDTDGAILSLKIIDRGIYKEFPADLATGIPLEYDHILLGDEHTGEFPPKYQSGLGQYDPITGEKLPAPGAYDPLKGEYGQYSDPFGTATFGTGARVFLTAREIPDCSERADVRSRLGIDPITVEIPYVEHLANQLNNGLLNAGYDPNDINFSPNPLNPDIGELVLNAPPFDGVEFDELTPGFLDKLGIPPGDYNPDITELVSVDATRTNDTDSSNLDEDPGRDGLRDLIDGDDGLGGGRLGFGDDGTTGYSLPEEVMAIYGVNLGGFASDGSSILGNANVVYVGDLFQYELRNLDGSSVDADRAARDCRVLYLESQRYNKESDIALANANFVTANIPATKEAFDQVWIDDDGTGKWAYYEGGLEKRSQVPLVDPTFIRNTIVYDSETGEKDYDYDMWDPFKGVFPAFVDAEIKYFSENDPVVYTSRRAVFGPDQVGQVWWNTSGIRYYWYEQGSNKERWLNWGKSFPGSSIALFEWVESKVPPAEYQGTGVPKNISEFITERTIDPSTGTYVNCYYFWVQNVREVSNQAATLAKRKFSTFDLAKYLADPIGQGINTVSYISAGTQTSQNIASFVMSNLTKTLREDEQNIQINLSRNLNPIGLKHTSFKLLREEDNNSEIPEDLANKLIDSLTEIDAAGNIVPADNLSNVERYGVKFRPRQTMFKYPKEARRALQYIVNEIMSDVKLNTLNTTWQTSMSSMNIIETVNWYAVKRIDGNTNEKIRYDNTYRASFTVSSVKELDALSNVPDGTIVMVRASQADRYQLWMFEAKNDSFKQIAIENETVRIKDDVYYDLTDAMQTELREFLYVLKDNIFEGSENFNKVFFELLKYALGEQPELDWAFKTSYVYIEKEEEDLVQRVGYKPDNFDSVIEYLNEVKPYSAKIREYKDGKRPPMEHIKDQMLSDFDIPPFADSDTGEVRTLDFNFGPDRTLASNSDDYTKAYGGFINGQTEWDTAKAPVRTGNVSLIFDRVDWRLAQTHHNLHTTAYSVSIGEMMANINSASTNDVSNTETNNYTASSRIFKFDPEVRSQFNTDVDNYFGVNSSSNTSIVENGSQLSVAVAAGAMNATLTMVKQKVGGTWQGEEFDANVFTRVVAGSDPLELQTAYGYDSTPFDATEGFGDNWDEYINVQNFEGIFAGDSTYREVGTTYDGFDGWTFNHLLYGEERPEELVYLSPLENLVMHVRTEPNAFDANGSVVDSISVGPYIVDNVSTSDANNIVTITSSIAAPLLSNNDTVTIAGSGTTSLNGDYAISNLTSTTFTIEKAGITANIISNAGDVSISSGVDAVAVEYLVHQDLFGGTEYLRILTDGSTSTTTTRPINAWDTEIEVVDPSVLPQPTPGIPAAVWLDNSERIEYNRISGNKLRGITRGTRGTTIPNGPAFVYSGDEAVRGNTYISHPSGVSVVSAGNEEVFDISESNGGSPGFADRDPDTAIWLKSDGSTRSLSDRTNRSTVTTIGAFLHGDIVSSIGFDSVAWDSIGWDSI